jgi:hypothetical protein
VYLLFSFCVPSFVVKVFAPSDGCLFDYETGSALFVVHSEPVQTEKVAGVVLGGFVSVAVGEWRSYVLPLTDNSKRVVTVSVDCVVPASQT